MGRARQINVLLSDEEYAMLEEIAVERGLDRSSTLRHLITREAAVLKTLTPLAADAALVSATHGGVVLPDPASAFAPEWFEFVVNGVRRGRRARIKQGDLVQMHRKDQGT